MSESLARARTPGPQRLIERDLRTLTPRALVLAIGEGTGVNVIDLAARFPHLRFIATDLEPTFAREIEARRREAGLDNVWVVVADAAHLPFCSKAFSLSYARNVLQFVSDPHAALRESARVTRSVAIFRDIANWPFYLIMRRLQSWTLTLRGRREAAATVWSDARFVSGRLIQQRAHGLTFRQWAQQTGRFDRVRYIGHDLLWWDRDRDIPLIGLVGARFGLRCTVAR